MEEGIYFVETDYTIQYNTGKPIPIPEIIKSLKSIEHIIHKTPVFVENAYKGIKVLDVEVYVDTLKAGSLKEKFLIKYIFKGEENYEQAKQVVEKVLEDNGIIRTVVAIGIGALTTYGIMSAMGPAEPSKHIEAYNNTIVNIGGEVELTGEDISTILSNVTNKKDLAKNAIDVMKPAKIDPDSTIEIEGFESLTINKDVIRDTPDEYVPPVQDEKIEKYTNADVVIYASDRDKTDSVWAGIAPGLIDKRVSFTLGEGIDPKKLHRRLRFKADIKVTNKFSRRKKIFEPKSVEIIEANIK